MKGQNLRVNLIYHDIYKKLEEKQTNKQNKQCKEYNTETGTIYFIHKILPSPKRM